MSSIQEVIVSLIVFINNVLLPLFFAVALLFFVFNSLRFFILGNDEESRNNAKALALYGIGAFVILVSIWGIVNLLVSGLGWGTEYPVTPDYMIDYYYF